MNRAGSTKISRLIRTSHEPADPKVERVKSNADDSSERERLEEGTEEPKARHQGSDQEGQEAQHACDRVRPFHEQTGMSVFDLPADRQTTVQGLNMHCAHLTLDGYRVGGISPTAR